MLPKRPLRGNSVKGSGPSPSVLNEPLRPPDPSITMESSVSVQDDEPPVKEGKKGSCEHSFPTTLDLGGQYL